MSIIRFENVHKSFNGQTVLHDFSMNVQPGETKVVLGGSGSGKTTILKMVNGLVRPDRGKVWVKDREISKLPEEELNPIRKKIGMVFQGGALFDSLSVAENVAYRLREDGSWSEERIRETVRQLLGFVGLEHAIDKIPSQLSGGMRRRVAISRALAGNPPIVLYDEPTAGLDPITSRTICQLLIQLRDLQRVSSILVTHDLGVALTLAREFALLEPDGRIVLRSESDNFCLINTRFVMLKDGKIIFEGTDEALRKTEDNYIQDFIH